MNFRGQTQAPRSARTSRACRAARKGPADVCACAVRRPGRLSGWTFAMQKSECRKSDFPDVAVRNSARPASPRECDAAKDLRQLSRVPCAGNVRGNDRFGPPAKSFAPNRCAECKLFPRDRGDAKKRGFQRILHWEKCPEKNFPALTRGPARVHVSLRRQGGWRRARARRARGKNVGFL